MRVGQDLCIALVLAVVSVGSAKAALGAAPSDDSLAIVERAIAGSGLSEEQARAVRSLIALAQERAGAGDEEGAALAMAQASSILGIG
jgi:hypothetical protein